MNPIRIVPISLEEPEPTVLIGTNNVVTFESLSLEQTNEERVIENHGDLTLVNVVVTGGSYGGDGGGIHNDGILTVQAASQITGNVGGLFSPESLDQANEAFSGTGTSCGNGDHSPVYQTFTPTDRFISRIELGFQTTYANTGFIKLREASAGPAGLLLAESQPGVLSTSGGGWMSYVFDTPVQVTPGAVYSIEKDGETSFGGTWYVTGDTYSGGQRYSCGGTPSPTEDYKFRTFGTAISVPGNGGGIFNDGGEVTILNSTVVGNVAAGGEDGADGRGGGIHNTDGEVTVDASIISNNTAPLTDTENGFPNSFGGGIYSDGGTITVVNDSSITGNSANNGGGIYNLYGTLNATDSSISDNTAWNVGGGLVEAAPDTANLNNVTVSGNTAYEGAGIYVNTGTLNAVLTTVADNTADYDGGGIYNDYGTVNFEDGALTGNEALEGKGGGIFSTGELFVQNGDDSGQLGIRRRGYLQRGSALGRCRKSHRRPAAQQRRRSLVRQLC